MSNKPPCKLPSILRRAYEALETLPLHLVQGVFSGAYNRKQRKRRRSMRPERKATLQKVLRVLVRRTSLDTGHIVMINYDDHGGKSEVDMTLKEMACQAGVSKSTLCDCLAYLRALGLLWAEPQGKARVEQAGRVVLAVGSCHRRLKHAFWSLLGLLSDFVEARAQSNGATETQRVEIAQVIEGLCKGTTFGRGDLKPKRKAEPESNKEFWREMASRGVPVPASLLQ